MNRTIFSLVAVAVLAAGCAATKSGDADDIRYSGYLSSYEGLVKTADSDFAAFRYIKPGIDLLPYTGILVEKPQALMSEQTTADIGTEDMAYLLSSFDESLRTTLGTKFKLVSQPGPGVLRVRSCLTDADSSIGALTPFSRLVPVGLVISTAKKVATGTAVNVGKVTAEMEIVDAASGEQLGAAVDRRIGTGVTRLMFTNWGDVRAVFDVWAERTAERLQEKGLRPVR